MTFVLLAFATFAAWEYLLVLCPISLPALLQPLLVAGVAYGVSCIPDDRILVVLAAAGAVGVLHSVVRHLHEPSGPPMVLRRGRRSEPSPAPLPGVGTRVPDLP